MPPKPEIIARDEIEIGRQAEGLRLRPGGRLRIVRRDTKAQAAAGEVERHGSRIVDGRKAPETEGLKQIVHLAIERGVRTAAERMRPQRTVFRGRSGDQRRGRQEAALVEDVLADRHEFMKPALVAGAQDAHHLIGRRAPGGVEIDERAVLVEKNAVERH